MKHLSPALFPTCEQLTEWEFRTADYAAPSTYAWRDAEYRPIRVGEHWGLPGTTAFIRRTVVIPKSAQGRKVGLALVTGGEGLVRLNGRPYHGLDANRWFVPLLEKAAGGEQFDVEVEVYNPILPPPDLMNNPGSTQPQANLSLARADIALMNESAADLWYTLRVCADAALGLPDSSPSRQRMLAAMHVVVERFELADPYHLDTTAVNEALARLRSEVGSLAERQPGTMLMIGQSHIDLAWLWPVKETVRKASRTFSTVCTLMDEYPHYRFTQSQAQLYAFIKQHYPELYARVKEQVQKGRWEIVGGMWVEPDLNIPSGESLVRQVLFGQRFWQQEFGRKSTIEWLPDTFGYCAALPQILHKAGIDSFMTVKMYWNDTNRFPYDLFWWQGIDGTRVLSFINHGLNESATARDIGRHWEANKQRAIYPVSMYLYGHGDGGGGVTREMLEYIAREEQLPGLPQVETGTAAQFFAGVHGAHVNLPTWSGDLYLEFHRGTYTTQAQVKKANRKGEFLLREAELWSVAATPLAWQYPRTDLRQAWEKLLLNQFHDILPGTSIPQVYKDAAADHAEVQRLGNQVRDGALQVLASASDTRGDGQPVVVFNSLSWPRSEVVRLPLTDMSSVCSVSDENGNSLPAQQVVTLSGQHELWLLADEVPAMGQRTFWLHTGAAKQSAEKASESVSAGPMRLPATWETPAWVVEFSAQGQITRLYDKANAREVVPAGSVANQLQLFMDRPLTYDAWEIDPRFTKMPFMEATLEAAEVVTSGPVADILRFRWTIGQSAVMQDMVLYHHSGRIDFPTHVSWHEEHRLLKVAFPVEVLAAQATYEIPFGSIQRATHNNTTWEQAQHEVCGHKWADLSEGRYGVSLLNDCKYGYDIKGNVMRLTLLRAPKRPDPNADMGEHHFTYALYPHAGDWRDGGTVQAAFSLNVPLTASKETPHNGSLGKSFSLATVDVDHVVLDTIKAAEDSDDMILRFYEAYGERGPVRVQLAYPIAAVTETNLLEEPEQSVAAEGHAFSFSVQPYEIKTFKVTLAS